MSIVEMKVPVIGESVTEVTLSQWLKGNGEYVALDEMICEFESDKATLEFPAEAAGKLIWVAEPEQKPRQVQKQTRPQPKKSQPLLLQ